MNPQVIIFVCILIFSSFSTNPDRVFVNIGQNSQGHAIGIQQSAINKYAKDHHVSRAEAVDHFKQELCQ